MKEWWNNLGLREKQSLSIGTLIVSFFLIYLIIWAPINTHNQTLREDISHNQKLLLWMQEADQRIQTTEKLLHKKSTFTNSAALLNFLQKEINESPLKDNLSQMNQTENNAIQITFQKVNFDTLIKWLIELWKKQGITVSQIAISPDETQGDVHCVIILS